MKICKRILTVIALTLLFLIINTVTANAGYQKLNSLDFIVDAKDNGDMVITEKWDVYIDETNTLFKTFKIDNTYDGITDVQVSEIENGGTVKFLESYSWNFHVNKDYFHGLNHVNENGVEEFEIAWGVGLDNSSDTRQYEIKYTVKNHVTLYNDAAQIYWQLIGKDFAIPVEKITGTINLPSGIETKEEIMVWAHGPLNGNITIDSLNKISFRVDDFKKDMLEIRLLTPAYVYGSSFKIVNSTIIDSVVNEETIWAEEANERRREYEAQQKMIKMVVNVVTIALIAGNVLGLFKLKSKLGETKKQEPEEPVEYFREIPNEVFGPAEASFLYHFSKGGTRVNISKVISGMFLNMSLKKWIEFEADPGDKKKVTIILKDAGKDLNKSENLVYNYLKKIADSVSAKKADSEKMYFTMKDFEKYSIKHNSSLMKLLDKVDEIAKEENISCGNFDLEERKKYNNWNLLMSLGFIAIIVYIFCLFSSPYVLILIGAAIINMVLLGKIRTRVNGLTQKGVNEKSKWDGLYKYMKDFSLLNEREVPELVLWEKFLVYATAFGIADKVLKQLKVKFPELQDEDYMRTHYTYMHFMGNSNFSSGFINSINSSIGSAVNYSSGGGSGGGFSGGGGGGRTEVAEAVAVKKSNQ